MIEIKYRKIHRVDVRILSLPKVILGGSECETSIKFNG